MLGGIWEVAFRRATSAEPVSDAVNVPGFIRVWSPEPGTSSRTTWLPSGGEVPETSRQGLRLQFSLPGRGRTSLPGTTAPRSGATLSDAGWSWRTLADPLFSATRSSCGMIANIT